MQFFRTFLLVCMLVIAHLDALEKPTEREKQARTCFHLAKRLRGYQEYLTALRKLENGKGLSKTAEQAAYENLIHDLSDDFQRLCPNWSLASAS